MSEGLAEMTEITEGNLITTAFSPSRETNEPAWLQEQRGQAWKKFQSLPMPRRTDEAWRFANLKKFQMENWQLAPAIDQTTRQSILQRQSTSELDPAARLTFANDELIASEFAPLVAEQGIVCLPFAQALSQHEEAVRRYFMTREAELGSEKFAALHLAYVRSGIVVIVPKGVVLDAPIEINHWVDGDHSAIFPHTLIVAEANSQVTVLDHYRSTSATDPGLCIAVGDIHAGDGASVHYVGTQNLNPQSTALQTYATMVQRDANVQSLYINLGARWARTENVSHLLGKGSNSDMLSISLPEGEQEIDQRTLQNHESPHTTSDLLYKNALSDKSRTTFSGLIHVAEGAHYTDAYQTCRNLLLSPDAEANSMPGLEINADQVKCSHGSTSGRVDSEQLFYLMARGIPPRLAQRLIVTGFLEEVTQKLKNPTLQKALDHLIEEKFSPSPT